MAVDGGRGGGGEEEEISPPPPPFLTFTSNDHNITMSGWAAASTLTPTDNITLSLDLFDLENREK